MRTQLPLALLAATFACSLFAAPAHAQRARVFVASYGSDSASCGSFLSPCRNFQQAVNNVLAGGEVTAIDSAGFGPISIAKGVTITSPNGVEAGIVPGADGNAIIINAGSNDTVSLRGLTITGTANAGMGVSFQSGAALHIQNSLFQHLGYGVYFAPSTVSDLYVSDTTFADNLNPIVIGPGLNSPGVSGEFTSVVNRVTMENSLVDGIDIDDSGMSAGALDVTISDSVIARSATHGVSVSAQSVFTIATILNSRIVNGCDNPCSKNPGSTGVAAFGQFATITLNGSAILQNATGWSAFNGGHVESYGNNQIEFNPAGNTPPASFPLK